DLTMIGDFTYYTGMTFEGYANGLGFPVVSGGRYDNLLKQFGRPAPATGFALKTNRILDIVAAGENKGSAPVLMLYDAAGRAEALREASRLRGEGRIVETRLVAENGPKDGMVPTDSVASTLANEVGEPQCREIRRFIGKDRRESVRG
uniref:ATP phosphoribosyltransferase regulatory subunit n=1 Tax=Gorillibacterium massiliense TaxID=1280390 RepID=UPI000594D8E3